VSHWLELVTIVSDRLSGGSSYLTLHNRSLYLQSRPFLQGDSPVLFLGSKNEIL
jgi:hypothetical protein